MLEDALLLALRSQTPKPAPTDWLILALWKEGFDTFDIAEELKVSEHEIANRLMHIRSESTDCQKIGTVHHD